MLASRRAQVSRGARPTGWKVGWNEPTTQARLGIDTCAFGYLTDATEVPGDAPVDLSGCRLTGIEPELGILIDADVAAGSSATAMADAISAVCAAVEIIDINARFDDLAAVLAGNIWHHSYQLGPPVTLRGDTNPADVPVEVTRNGQFAMIPVNAMDVLGDLTQLVRFVADSLGVLGETLRAGDLILSGVLTPLPVWVKPGDRALITMGRLGQLPLDFVGGSNHA